VMDGERKFTPWPDSRWQRTRCQRRLHGNG
jgi:hypothetical protein